MYGEAAPERVGRVLVASVTIALSSAAALGACSRDAGADSTDDGAAERGTGTTASAAAGRGDDRSLAPEPDARNAPPPARAPAGAEPTILFIGTSLTAGYGVDAPDAFPAVVGRMLDSAGTPAKIVNAGVSGETSAGARTRIDWVLRQPADVIVVETGANDGLRGLSVSAARENIQVMLDRIRAKQPSARVLLVQMEAPPNLGPAYTMAFHGMYAEIAKETGAMLMPFLLNGVAGDRSLNQADGIHPTPEGHRVIADLVWRELRPMLTTISTS